MASGDVRGEADGIVELDEGGGEVVVEVSVAAGVEGGLGLLERGEDRRNGLLGGRKFAPWAECAAGRVGPSRRLSARGGRRPRRGGRA